MRSWLHSWSDDELVGYGWYTFDYAQGCTITLKCPTEEEDAVVVAVLAHITLVGSVRIQGLHLRLALTRTQYHEETLLSLSLFLTLYR